MQNPLSLAEARAKYPTLSLSWLRILCQQRRIVAEKRAPRLWELDEESLKNYLANRPKPGPRPQVAGNTSE